MLVCLLVLSPSPPAAPLSSGRRQLFSHPADGQGRGPNTTLSRVFISKRETPYHGLSLRNITPWRIGFLSDLFRRNSSSNIKLLTHSFFKLLFWETSWDFRYTKANKSVVLAYSSSLYALFPTVVKEKEAKSRKMEKNNIFNNKAVPLKNPPHQHQRCSLRKETLVILNTLLFNVQHRLAI